MLFRSTCRIWHWRLVIANIGDVRGDRQPSLNSAPTSDRTSLHRLRWPSWPSTCRLLRRYHKLTSIESLSNPYASGASYRSKPNVGRLAALCDGSGILLRTGGSARAHAPRCRELNDGKPSHHWTHKTPAARGQPILHQTVLVYQLLARPVISSMSAHSQLQIPDSSTRDATTSPTDAAVVSLVVNHPVVESAPSSLPTGHSTLGQAGHPEPPSLPGTVVGADSGIPTPLEEDASAFVAAAPSAAPDIGTAVNLRTPVLVDLQERVPSVPSDSVSETGEADVGTCPVENGAGDSRSASPVSSHDQPRAPPRMRSLGVQTQVVVVKRGESTPSWVGLDFS